MLDCFLYISLRQNLKILFFFRIIQELDRIHRERHEKLRKMHTGEWAKEQEELKLKNNEMDVIIIALFRHTTTLGAYIV